MVQEKGLLFLATEHGVYFSLNDGAKWESLQLNLPDTPIRDLVIKDNDVVLGSHGRGFWIMDDIEPIRQHREEMKNQQAILYQPNNAIRGISEARIQYHLNEEVAPTNIRCQEEVGGVICNRHMKQNGLFFQNSSEIEKE